MARATMRREINITVGSGFIDLNFQNYQGEPEAKRMILADLAQATHLVRSNWEQMEREGLSYSTINDRELHLKLLREELDELLDEWNDVTSEHEDGTEQEQRFDT